jgi:hypothetical protein
MSSRGQSKVMKAEVISKETEKVKKAETFPWGADETTVGSIAWLKANLEKSEFRTNTGSDASERGRVSPRKVTKGLILDKARIEMASKKGKVIDVSDMDVETGVGSKMFPFPSEKSKTGKIGSRLKELPIISNNLEKYVSAIKRLYPDDLGSYEADIEVVKAGLQKKPERKRGAAVKVAKKVVETSEPAKKVDVQKKTVKKLKSTGEDGGQKMKALSKVTKA